MKGLFIKDLMLMKMQGRFFVLVFAIAAIMGFSMKDTSFTLGYITLLIPLFSLSTVSYDEFDNGCAFLFSLPITRKLYVYEKYLFSLSLCALSMLFGIILSVIIDAAYSSFSIEVFAAAPIIFVLVSLLLSVMLPLQLKFGAEKARIAMIATGAGVFLLGSMLARFAEAYLTGLTPMLVWLSELDIAVIILAAIAVAAVALTISTKISMKIMNKKEF